MRIEVGKVTGQILQIFLSHANLFRLYPLGAMDSHQSTFLKGMMRSHFVFRKIPVAVKKWNKQNGAES